MKAKYLLLIAVIALLSSCSSQFAGSFGKRKYNKGYYFDFASHTINPKVIPQRTSVIAKPAEAKVNFNTDESESTEMIPESPVKLQNKPAIVHKVTLAIAQNKVTEQKQESVKERPDNPADNGNHNAPYSDYGLLALICLVIGTVVAGIAIIESVFITGFIGWFFFSVSIVAGILSIIFSAIGAAHPYDIHHSLARTILSFYSLIYSAGLILLSFIF